MPRVWGAANSTGDDAKKPDPLGAALDSYCQWYADNIYPIMAGEWAATGGAAYARYRGSTSTIRTTGGVTALAIGAYAVGSYLACIDKFLKPSAESQPTGPWY